jgi:hypothetical protein
MTPDIVVFLGPSLDPDRAAGILRADYRPPARRGDILAAARDGAKIIGLIDGVFFQDCAVAHREILEALRSGVRVFGASSMGALRAAELDTLGMEGVGRIYRAYRSGELVADDEVALVFDPVYFAPLSEPLVNIRATIARAEEKGVIDAGAAREILHAARSLYFPDRTYDRIAGAAGKAVAGEALERFLAFARSEPADVKREDACLALRRIREIAGELGIDAGPG